MAADHDVREAPSRGLSIDSKPLSPSPGSSSSVRPLKSTRLSSDAGRGADRADAVGGELRRALEDDAVARQGDAAQVLHRARRDVAGEEAARGGTDQPAVEQDACRRARARSPRRRARSGSDAVRQHRNRHDRGRLAGAGSRSGPATSADRRPPACATARSSASSASARLGRAWPLSTRLMYAGVRLAASRRFKSSSFSGPRRAASRPGAVEVLVVVERAREAGGHVLVGDLGALLDQRHIGRRDAGPQGELDAREAELRAPRPDAGAQVGQPAGGPFGGSLISGLDSLFTHE